MNNTKTDKNKKKYNKPQIVKTEKIGDVRLHNVVVCTGSNPGGGRKDACTIAKT